MGNDEQAHKNFPPKWAWPMSRDPTIIGILSNISSKLFELVTSNLVSGFDCRVLHNLVYWRVVRSAILGTAWLLVLRSNYSYEIRMQSTVWGNRLPSLLSGRCSCFIFPTLCSPFSTIYCYSIITAILDLCVMACHRIPFLSEPLSLQNVHDDSVHA